MKNSLNGYLNANNKVNHCCVAITIKNCETFTTKISENITIKSCKTITTKISENIIIKSCETITTKNVKILS